MKGDHPLARREDVLVEHIDGELVVVDSRSQQAHALPALAATVWSLCDGNHGVAAIAARTGFSPDQVTDVLTQLHELDLLETAGTDDAVDRRALLTRTAKLGGVAALTAPILTVALPTAAHASSTSATYTIANTLYRTAGPGGFPPGNYEYVVNPGTATAQYDFDQVVYAGSPPPSSAQASNNQPAGVPYVEIAVNSDASLALTLVQYNGAGSATYTDPDGTSGSVSVSGTQINGFSSGTATLVVSAT